MGRPNLVGDTLLLGPTSFVDDLKDNVTGGSTLEVQSKLWTLNQDTIRVRNISNTGS